MGKRFDFEFMVIGAGAAGVTAARALAEAGRKVALVEQDKWGGTKLNYRNVPQKALFTFSHLYARAVAGSRFGLSSANLRYNYPMAMRWKEHAVNKALEAEGASRKALEAIGISCIRGKAHFAGRYDVAISGQEKQISASKFLIATGTEMALDGIAGVDVVKYYTPATILDVPRPPKTALIVGGGASGCEVAHYLAELGTKVVITEMAGRLLPKEDEEVGQLMQQYFTKRLGARVFTGTKVMALERDKVSSRVVFMRGGQERTVRVDTIILATGRKPAIDLGLKNVGVSFDKNGIIVDKTLQTSARNVFAVGDVLGGESTTERAVYSAEVAARNMLGRNKTFANYDGFMRVIDTEPQIATVGLNEDGLAKRARKYRKVLVPLNATSAANTSDDKIGFLKMMVDSQGKILGATMVGPSAAEVLQEISLAIRHNLPLVQVASTPHVADEWGNLVKIAAKLLVKK